jgi:hypothetical protein
MITRARRTARRHLRRILVLLGLVILVIVGSNNLVFRMIRSPEHVTTAQMIYGWARLYKPMVYDSVDADIVSFGFSWVRDIFDPVPASALTGKTFFNFGVSGATSFESLRLIQNALAIDPPEHVFLDLESFFDAPRASLVEQQFDERILYVNRDGSPNTQAAFNRWIKINTSGAALAFNIRFFETLWDMRAGKTREEVLPSYERRDWRQNQGDIDLYRAWMTTNARGERAVKQLTTRSFVDLEQAVRLLCDAGVRVHLYEAPYICGGNGDDTREGLALMRRLQASCTTPITYHSFRYPNAVTMEGLSKDAGLSLFYRPDGHPRPPLGQMMLTRIFALQDHPDAPPLPKDFGVDLMTLGDDEAEAWIAEHAARCYGGWRPGAYAATLAEMESLMPRWREMYGPR